MQDAPPIGSMVYWRFTLRAPCAWTFGYVTQEGSGGLIRMGASNGDTIGGSVVDPQEIEWKPYKS